MATNGRVNPNVNPDTLSGAQRRTLAGPALSSPFDVYDRLFPDFQGGDVFDYSWDAREIETMLRRSGKVRSVEQVLTLPIRGAELLIQGGSDRSRALVEDNLGSKLKQIVAQCTAACAYRKSFFELVWKINGSQVLLDEVAWRPPYACEAGFDPETGRPMGFRQRAAHPGGIYLPAEGVHTLPGYIRIPRQRAFIFTYGTHRDPVHGLSDLDVAFFCYETIQKIMFLWFKFLELQSLPNVVAYGQDPTSADKNRDAIAGQKAGGVIGVARDSNDPTAKMFEVLESSGKGAGQFQDAIKYLETSIVASVLAGFTELADNSTASRVGSYALSKDQSEFFLSSRQGVADEMAEQIRKDLFGPLVAYNFGADEPVPTLQIGPLADADTERALDMLSKVIAAPALNVPGEFVDELVTTTASYLGLDTDALSTAMDKFAVQRAAQQEQAQQVAGAVAKASVAKPAGPKLPTALSGVADATALAFELVNRAETGESPADVLAELNARAA